MQQRPKNPYVLLAEQLRHLGYPWLPVRIEVGPTPRGIKHFLPANDPRWTQ